MTKKKEKIMKTRKFIVLSLVPVSNIAAYEDFPPLLEDSASFLEDGGENSMIVPYNRDIMELAESYLRSKRITFCVDMANEIETTEEFAEYINTNPYWEYFGNEVIEKRGWVELYDKDMNLIGIADYPNKKKVVFESGQALVVGL